MPMMPVVAETTEDHECDGTLTVTDLREALDRLPVGEAATLVSATIAEHVDDADTDTVDCPFAGDVEVKWISRYEGRWDCPVCAHEHEVTDDGEDHDAYDRYHDR